MQRSIEDYVSLGSFNNKSIGKNVADTSIEAYRELMRHPYELNGRHNEYLETLRAIGKPSTDQEVSVFAGHRDPNYFRPRRYELAGFDEHCPDFVKFPVVVEVGKRKCEITGVTAKIWWFKNDFVLG